MDLLGDRSVYGCLQVPVPLVATVLIIPGKPCLGVQGVSTSRHLLRRHALSVVLTLLRVCCHLAAEVVYGQVSCCSTPQVLVQEAVLPVLSIEERACSTSCLSALVDECVSRSCHECCVVYVGTSCLLHNICTRSCAYVLVLYSTVLGGMSLLT